MATNRGIAFRLSFWILAGITLIFSVILAYNYFVSRRMILRNAETTTENLALSTVHRIDSVLGAVGKVPKNLAVFLEEFSYRGGDILSAIRIVVEKNPEIYGVAVAFEPHAYKANERTFAPYYFKHNGKMNFTNIQYDYFTSDWYQIARELNAPIWSEPYFDEEAGGIMMAAFSVPFYKWISGERVLAGVVAADISLEWLKEIVASMKIARTGYGFLISKNGTIITHPDSHLIMNETIFTVSEDRGDPEMREVGRRMVRGESGFVRFTSFFTGKMCWMRYAPLPSNNWSLAVVFPEDEMTSDLVDLNRTVLFFSLAGFLILLLMIVWISRSITRPLTALSRAATQIALGDLEARIPNVKTADEVGTLADSFKSMTSSLKQYIFDLKETTAAKERIESELKIAHDIQMSILPKNFPPFPNRTEFDILARIEPAREVGGDLYDFFFMDESHLCLVIGDVSGKGIPASLFMAVTKTMIKAKATKGLSPETVLTHVNQDLSLENDSMMFVTLFLGILDTGTGELEYCNAGHNPPLLLSPSGRVLILQPTGGIALGVVEEVVYQSRKVILKKGDSLFLYTDGVTEAMNKSEELFSEGRLIKELAEMKGKSIQEIVTDVMGKVSSFSAGVPQADDITLMVIRYYGKNNTA